MGKWKRAMIHDGFQVIGFSKEEAEQADKLSEIGCINAISPEEVTAAFQKAVSDIKKAMPCESCTHYPPSACDGKPCCACNPDDHYLNCYQEKEQVDSISQETVNRNWTPTKGENKE